MYAVFAVEMDYLALLVATQHCTLSRLMIYADFVAEIIQLAKVVMECKSFLGN